MSQLKNHSMFDQKNVIHSTPLKPQWIEYSFPDNNDDKVDDDSIDNDNSIDNENSNDNSGNDTTINADQSTPTNRFLWVLQKDRKSDLDCIYGMRKNAKGVLMIPNSNIHFGLNAVNVEEETYVSTLVPLELLFRKTPDE